MRLDGAHDIRMDVNVYEGCRDDVRRLCGNVRHGGGRAQACLVGSG